MKELQSVKQRFGIIGNFEGLNRAIDVAVQVAPTDLSVLITGESGTGKEVFPQVVHAYGQRKHGPYIAVNCGAIPGGTIDSELFGHEKGAFTGATDSRKGYFEVASGGSIFLDEVAELPLATQVRLLRVLESGEFIRVGSSKVQKTDVRVIAATNIDIINAVSTGRFREDLFYRLNTVPIKVPALRERGDDILLLFRKFAVDFAERYRMPAIRPDHQAREMLLGYYWPGNVRQLKNITEQISIIEQERDVTAPILARYLPDYQSGRLPVPVRSHSDEKGFNSEREILYKVLFDMKRDMHDLKNLVYDLLASGQEGNLTERGTQSLHNLFDQGSRPDESIEPAHPSHPIHPAHPSHPIHPVHPSHPIHPGHPSHPAHSGYPPARESRHIEDTEEVVEESLSLADSERELIMKALEKNSGKRKLAAAELGISERTLYRKIKEYGLDA